MKSAIPKPLFVIHETSKYFSFCNKYQQNDQLVNLLAALLLQL